MSLIQSAFEEADQSGPVGLAAYENDDFAHATARASQLICLAVYLGGDDEQIEMIAPFASHLEVPRPRPATKTTLRYSLEWLEAMSLGLKRLGGTEGNSELGVFEIELVSANRDVPGRDVNRLWQNIDSFRSSRAAFALLYGSLRDHSESVRVAAASALHALHPMRNSQVVTVLSAGLESQSALIVEMAQSALADSGLWSPPRQPNGGGPEQESAIATEAIDSASVIIHGTFAALADDKHRWYDPSAALPVRILRESSSDLYVGMDYFRWTGGYTEDTRRAGTDKLLRWCKKHGVRQLSTVYAHSHGGNVVLDAIAQGLKVELLVLLHVPILKRDPRVWALIERSVDRVLDLRTPLDWVVILDGLRTGSRNGFSGELTCVEQPRPPVTQFTAVSHTRYTKDNVWASLGLTSYVLTERSLI